MVFQCAVFYHELTVSATILNRHDFGNKLNATRSVACERKRNPLVQGGGNETPLVEGGESETPLVQGGGRKAKPPWYRAGESETPLVQGGGKRNTSVQAGGKAVALKTWVPGKILKCRNSEFLNSRLNL